MAPPTARLRARRGALRLYGVLPIPLRRLITRLIAPRFTVGCLAVLRHDGDVLMLRQRHHPGGWTLPGGLLDAGETPHEALARELGEELGVRIDLPAQPTHIVVATAARHLDLLFAVDLPARPPVRADQVEVISVAWRPADEPDLHSTTRAALDTVGGGRGER